MGVTTIPDGNAPCTCTKCGGTLRIHGGCLRCAMSGALEALDEACADPAKAALLSEESRAALPAVNRGFVSFALPDLPWRIGQYEALREVATGGMGTVYEAEDLRLGRRVALKMIRGFAFSTPEEKARFKAEAAAAAALDHPNIVPIYEVGEAAGQPYFTMKLVTGGTVAQRLRAGPMPSRETAALVARIAHAVHHAHQHGVLHRDIKPGNILLDEKGTPYLTDFGLAKLSTADAMLTMSHAQVGTPHYMSPEQASGRVRDISTASDVWALGAVLYEMLSGRVPFAGESSAEIMRRVVEDEAEPLRIISAKESAAPLDRDICTIVARCLEKEPARRMSSAELLAEELERWLRGDPIYSRSIPAGQRWWKWVRRHRTAAAGIAVAAAALIGGTAMSLWQAAEARRHTQAANAAQAEAERQLRDAEAATEVLTRTVANMEFYTAGPGISREDLVRGLIKSVGGFSGDPVRKARLLAALGPGLPSDEAARLAAEALALAEPHLQANDPLLWDLRLEVARHKGAEPETLAESVTELRSIRGWMKKNLEAEHPRSIWTSMLLARNMTFAGQHAEAEPVFEELEQLARLKPKALTPENRVGFRGDYARFLFATGRSEEALAMGRENVRTAMAQLGPHNYHGGRSILAHAEICLEAGLLDEAAKTAQTALDIFRRVGGPLAEYSQRCLTFLLDVHRQRKDRGAVLAVHRETLQELDRKLGPAHQATAAGVRDYSRALVGARRLEEADLLGTEWLRRVRLPDGTLPAASEAILRAHSEMLRQSADAARAEAALRELVALLAKNRPTDLQRYADMGNLAQALIRQKKWAEAETLLQTVVETLEARGTDNPSLTAQHLPAAKQRLEAARKALRG